MHLTRMSVVILLTLAASLGLVALVYAGVTQITRSVPSSVTVLVVPAEQIADVDESGIVDLADLLLVRDNFGMAPPADPRADVDGNGAVDVRDLALMARMFGRLVPVTAGLIPDANLEAAVLEALEKPEGDITVQDLQGLTILFAAHREIEDLTGLEHASNLTNLLLCCNQITDLTPLAGLTNLQTLDLLFNQISDLTPLAGITNLQQLKLEANQLSDLTPLAGLVDLRILYLDNNQISNLVPLANLTKIGDPPTTAPLREGVTIFLGLQNNQISDVQPLVDNPGLDDGDGIDLRGNPLSGETINTLIPQLEARGVTVLHDAPTTFDVIMQDIAYMPATTTIKAGDTVLWTQQDSPGEIHTVTSGRIEDANAGDPLDPRLDSPFLFEGDTYSRTFYQPGTSCSTARYIPM